MSTIPWGTETQSPKKTTSKNDFMTVDEFCEILDIGYNMAYKLLSSGEIGAFKIGSHWKIPRAGVDAYIAKKTAEAMKGAN